MNRTTMTLVALLAMLGFTSSVAAEAPVPLVVVNGDTITTADMDKQIMTMHRRLDDEQMAGFDYHKLLDKLVNDRLLIQEALAIGMHEEKIFVDELQELQGDRARRLFVKETFKPEIDVGDDDIKERFERFYFKIQLRTLAVATREEADRLKAQIEAGAPMDSLAKELSLDSRKFKGGLHSLKYWRDVPIVLRLAAQNLNPGELSEPFKFQDAWMILRVEQRLEADVSELEHWSKEIRKILTNTERDLAWQKFLDSLAVTYPETIDSTLMDKITADSSQLFRGEFLRGSSQTVIQVGTTEASSEEELRREISHTAMNSGDQVFDTIMTRAVTGSIQQARLSAAAVDQGYMTHPSVLDFVKRTEDSLLLENYLGENIVNRIVFNRREFKQYYDEHLDEFREADQVQLKALQVKTEDEAEQAATYLADGADFGFVVERLGRDDGVDHNENEWFSLTTFPTEVSEDLKKLESGRSTKPFQLADGWVIFRLKARRPGEAKTMEEVDGQIRQVMFQRKFDQLLDELLTALKETSVIEYDRQAIEDYLGEET